MGGYFASELKALVCSPDLDRRLDPQAIEEFFALGYIPDPHAIYRGVRKLPQAHSLAIRRGELPTEPRAYWDLSGHCRCSMASLRDIDSGSTEQVRTALTAAHP